MEIDMELKSFIVLYDGKFIRVYKENDADKVIAELEDDCTYWKTMSQKNAADNEVMAKQRAEAFKQRTEALKRERHHKFKRCLDMAARCESEEKRLEVISPMFDTNKECWEYGSDYWNKWHKRWLELAEQFKPNSTAQKENDNG